MTEDSSPAPPPRRGAIGRWRAGLAVLAGRDARIRAALAEVGTPRWRSGGPASRRSCGRLRRSRSPPPRRGRSGGGWRRPQAARSRPRPCWRSGRRGFAPSAQPAQGGLCAAIADELASGRGLSHASRGCRTRRPSPPSRPSGASGAGRRKSGSCSRSAPRHLARRRSRTLRRPARNPRPRRPPDARRGRAAHRILVAPPQRRRAATLAHLPDSALVSAGGQGLIVLTAGGETAPLLPRTARA